jgi:hypothetical protein
MKKLAFVLILLTSVTFVKAQLAFGPKLGYTASTLTMDKDSIQNDFKGSVHFGAFVRLGTKVYLQPELLFMTKGTQFEYKLFNGGLKQDIKLNTIDIPILVGTKVLNLKVANVRVMGGPVASFVTKKDIDNVQNLDDQLQGRDIKDSNWSGQVGVGVDVLNFTLDIRYEFGLSDVLEDNNTTYDFSDVKNNSYLVTLGWKIL